MQHILPCILRCLSKDFNWCMFKCQREAACCSSPVSRVLPNWAVDPTFHTHWGPLAHPFRGKWPGVGGAFQRPVWVRLLGFSRPDTQRLLTVETSACGGNSWRLQNIWRALAGRQEAVAAEQSTAPESPASPM